MFRSYSEPGGIKDELLATASEHNDIVKPVIIGETLNGQEIVVLKVTKDANERGTVGVPPFSSPLRSTRGSGSLRR